MQELTTKEMKEKLKAIQELVHKPRHCLCSMKESCEVCKITSLSNQLLKELKTILYGPEITPNMEEFESTVKEQISNKEDVKEVKCTRCGKILNLSVDITGIATVPEENDFSICYDCFTLHRFNKDLTIRKLTPEDKEEAPPEIPRIVFQLKLTKLLRGL